MENNSKNIDIKNTAFWKPTLTLRWKKVDIDELRYEKILQQLWISDIGEKEWCDVPEEY